MRDKEESRKADVAEPRSRDLAFSKANVTSGLYELLRWGVFLSAICTGQFLNECRKLRESS